jgi:hypothetical protein
MKRIRMPGIRRKRLLAAKLGIEIFPCPQMAEAGLVERRRCAGAEAA